MLTFWPAAGVCASAIPEAARRDRRSPPRHTSARNPRVEPSRCLTPLLLFVDRGWRDSPRGILHQPPGGPLGTAAAAARAPLLLAGHVPKGRRGQKRANLPTV